MLVHGLEDPFSDLVNGQGGGGGQHFLEPRDAELVREIVLGLDDAVGVEEQQVVRPHGELGGRFAGADGGREPHEGRLVGEKVELGDRVFLFFIMETDEVGAGAGERGVLDQEVVLGHELVAPDPVLVDFAEDFIDELVELEGLEPLPERGGGHDRRLEGGELDEGRDAGREPVPAHVADGEVGAEGRRRDVVRVASHLRGRGHARRALVAGDVDRPGQDRGLDALGDFELSLEPVPFALDLLALDDREDDRQVVDDRLERVLFLRKQPAVGALEDDDETDEIIFVENRVEADQAVQPGELGGQVDGDDRFFRFDRLLEPLLAPGGKELQRRGEDGGHVERVPQDDFIELFPALDQFQAFEARDGDAKSVDMFERAHLEHSALPGVDGRAGDAVLGDRHEGAGPVDLPAHRGADDGEVLLGRAVHHLGDELVLQAQRFLQFHEGAVEVERAPE